MKEKKSTNEYILYEMESKCEAQDYITKKNGILLDTKEDNPYKYYVVEYDALPPIAIFSEDHGIPPLFESDNEYLFIGADSRIYQIRKKVCWLLFLDSQIFDITILHKEKTICIICEVNVYILDFNGQIIWEKNFDIIVDWKYRKSQTELILYDINNESFCLSLVNKIQLTQTSQMNKMNNLL